MVGDSGKNDMMLAKNADMKSVLVLTGVGIESLSKKRHLWSKAKPTHIAEDCLDAVDKIVSYS
ncbi:HAD hydrolase-like protein [Desemzia sp. FAM 23991]|uniref:HAD hydrolase-like protein n=1 Tax=unclassified Desemzia TaxID=2685243 RepID=UPI0038845E30